MTVKESRPKVLNTLDSVVANLEADETVRDVEWKAVLTAREVLASCSTAQLAKAIEKVATVVQR
jgi:hypothetical protein